MKIDLPARLLARAAAVSASAKSMLMLGLLSVWVSPLLAQDDALRPPRTDEPPSGPKYIVLFVALVLAALVIFAAVLRSKRGHQD